MSEISIEFENQDLLVVNKPNGLAVQNETQQSGILPLLCEQLSIDKLWLVHRLDKVTSGLLILAKSAKAAATAGEMFAARKIEKYYLAISDKKSKKKQGSVVGDMYKIRDGKWALNKNLHQPAISQFYTLGLGDGNRLFVIKPRTGKTHQIRVMMKSLSSPILGDTLYGGSTADRTYLHAYALRFDYQGHHIELSCLPKSGEQFTALQSIDSQRYQTPWTHPWPVVPHKAASQ